MKRKLVLALAAVSLTAALGAAAATAGASSDPGVSADEILLGGTTPRTGRASAYQSVADGADAYFKYINSRGGVSGRKITYKVLDDAYNASQAIQAVRQLVEQEKVFAIFNALGTETNELLRPYLNASKVPHLFAASGATTFGADVEQYPYTIGFQPSYQAEGWVYGKYLARTAPGSRIAVLFQNDSYGKDLLAGLKRGLARSKARVIAAEPYEATASDVQSQVAKLKASGANTFAIFAVPPFSIQAYAYASRLGWRPKQTIVNAVASASNLMFIASEDGQNKVAPGSLTIQFLKDPTDPKWAKDKGVVLYRQIMKRFAPSLNANDTYHFYGMASAWTAVEALKRSGKEPTRAGLIKAVSSMNFANNPFLLPGIGIKTSGAGDHFPIEQVVLSRYVKAGWKTFGGLWTYRAT